MDGRSEQVHGITVIRERYIVMYTYFSTQTNVDLAFLEGEKKNSYKNNCLSCSLTFIIHGTPALNLRSPTLCTDIVLCRQKTTASTAAALVTGVERLHQRKYFCIHVPC